LVTQDKVSLISVIVLAWNGEKFLDACLASVLAQDNVSFELIVVDNASADGSIAITEKYLPRLRLIRNDYNLGFAAGNNVGIRAATGDAIVLLNQDTIVQPGWLRAIAETFRDPGIGIVGCKIFQPDGRTLLHTGAFVRHDDAFAYHIGQGELDQGQFDELTDCDYVTGAAMAIHRRVIQQLGGLDEQFHPAFYEEIDYCYRARRAGFRVVYQPQAVVHHFETTSLLPESLNHRLAVHRNRVRFVLRHWSVEELDAFALAEDRAIEASGSLDDVHGRARAYWDNVLAMPWVAAQRCSDQTLGAPLSDGKVRWLIGTLQSLRDHARRRVVALMCVPDPASARSLDWADWAMQLDQLAAIEMPRPIRFESRVPILGALLVRVREFFMTYSGVRQYADAVIYQQAAFNVQARRIFLETQQLVRQLEEQNARLAQQNAALSRLSDMASADDAALMSVWREQLMEWARTSGAQDKSIGEKSDGGRGTGD
jgi:GT2 family glycosyltransferase